MKSTFLFIIKAYQKVFTMGFAHCRFYPSCSNYTHEAIDRYGIFTGTWLGMMRLLRCSPFSKGGLDPVPDFYKKGQV